MPSDRQPARAQSSLLDRLMDERPDQVHDRPRTASETVSELRKAVRRDVEALLNARHPWRSVSDRYPALRQSPLGYGIADFAGGAFDDLKQQERLRGEIEAAIRRFEPRLSRVQVQLLGDRAPLKATLALRIEAQLQLDPTPEPISFDTMIDTTTADVVLRSLQES